MLKGFDPVTIFALITCESNFEPSAVHVNKNGTKDFSIFQINSTHIPEARLHNLDITNPIDNIKFGFVLLEQDGFTPWNASKTCRDTIVKSQKLYSEKNMLDGAS